MCPKGVEEDLAAAVMSAIGESVADLVETPFALIALTSNHAVKLRKPPQGIVRRSETAGESIHGLTVREFQRGRALSSSDIYKNAIEIAIAGQPAIALVMRRLAMPTLPMHIESMPNLQEWTSMSRDLVGRVRTALPAISNDEAIRGKIFRLESTDALVTNWSKYSNVPPLECVIELWTLITQMKPLVTECVEPHQIHGDLKLSNVMSRGGRLFVIDPAVADTRMFMGDLLDDFGSLLSDYYLMRGDEVISPDLLRTVIQGRKIEMRQAVMAVTSAALWLVLRYALANRSLRITGFCTETIEEMHTTFCTAGCRVRDQVRRLRHLTV
jgi:hypothetical protein